MMVVSFFFVVYYSLLAFNMFAYFYIFGLLNFIFSVLFFYMFFKVSSSLDGFSIFPRHFCSALFLFFICMFSFALD